LKLQFKRVSITLLIGMCFLKLIWIRYKIMRLFTKEIDIIKDVILNNIDDAKIILFGSRVYDDKKGGDIDICVKTKQEVPLAKKIKILTKLELAGIYRKVDLIVQTPKSKHLPIFDTIVKEGILL